MVVCFSNQNKIFVINFILNLTLKQKSEHLLDRIKKGNLRAFKYFYDDFFPVLNTFALKFLSEKPDSEDVVQEAFIYFWRKREDFYSISGVKSYLYKFVKTRSINLIRDTGNKSVVDIETLKDTFFFKESIIEIETYELLYNSIKKLSPQEQAVIELSIDGKKNQEIAEELNISINTVKTLKKRSYNKLRIELKDNIELLIVVFYILGDCSNLLK